MKLSRLNRRLHLYLAMALLPWFVMYGLSSLVQSHIGLISRLAGGKVERTVRFEEAYDASLSLDADEAERGAFARRVVDDHELECTFGVGPIKNGQIKVWCFTFFEVTMLTYNLESRRLTAEDESFRVDRFLTRMHGRGGFHHDYFLDDLWAVMVDLVCLGFMIWVVSGLYMWWKVPGQRRWGATALILGCLCFIAFTLGL